jgi:hypothetical protein
MPTTMPLLYSFMFSLRFFCGYWQYVKIFKFQKGTKFLFFFKKKAIGIFGALKEKPKRNIENFFFFFFFFFFDI